MKKWKILTSHGIEVEVSADRVEEHGTNPVGLKLYQAQSIVASFMPGCVAAYWFAGESED